jgi:glutamate/tyrosine decarboxylase-like PLP-dependent enzyme
MITLTIHDTKCRLENGEWSTDDEDLTAMLNEWTQNEIRTATIGEPFFILYSPSNPWPDMTIAQAAVETWEGEITDKGEAPEHEPNRIY